MIARSFLRWVSMLALVLLNSPLFAAESVICRDEQTLLNSLQRDVMQLRTRQEAMSALSTGTLGASVQLEDIFGRSVSEGGESATAWPAKLSCGQLQESYEVLLNERNWLLRNLDAQQKALWSGQPASFRVALRQLWLSRQRLQGQYDQFQASVDGEENSDIAAVSLAITDLQTQIKHHRLALLHLLPTLHKADESSIRSLLILWDRLYAQSADGAVLSDDALAALGDSASTAVDFFRFAQNDLLQQRVVLGHLRAWLWQFHRDQLLSLTLVNKGWVGLLQDEAEAVAGSVTRVLDDISSEYRDENAGRERTHWILWQSVKYVFGLALFVLLALLSRSLAKPLALVQRLLSKRFGRNSWGNQLLRLLAGLLHLLPWILGWIGLSVLHDVFVYLELPLLVPLLPLARLYILYGLLVVAGQWLLLRVSQQAGVYINQEQTRQVETTARRSARWLMWPWFVHDLLKMSLGASFAVDVVYWLSLAASYLALSVLLSVRRQDVRAALLSILPPLLDPWVDRILGGRRHPWLVPLCTPILLVAFAVTFVDRALADFDWYRKLTARGFRLRANQAVEDTSEPSSPTLEAAYTRFFLAQSDDHALPFIDTGLLAELELRVGAWLGDQSEENTLLLTGERGMGKSTAVGRLERKFQAQPDAPRILHIKVPAKTLDAESLYHLLSDPLGIDVSQGPAQLVKMDAELPPTIILLDNAHNLFLRRVGGLVAWQALLSLTNARLENIFWLISLNSQSWAYLNNVYRREFRFRQILRARPWTQQEVRSLIMSRNQQAGFKIRYDDVLLATRGPEAGSIRNAEQRYFSLLWDACGGNPSLALRLWISSLRPGRGQLMVGLPQETSSVVLEQLGTEAHFVYAAIAMHDNMTSDELEETTALSDSVVRSALKIGFDTGFMERVEDGRYQITPLWFHTIIRLLARKNLLNE